MSDTVDKATTSDISFIGMRELSRNPGAVIEKIEDGGGPLVISRHRKPIAILTAVSDQQAAAIAFASVPELVQSRDEAAKAIAAGEGTPATEVLARLEAEDEKTTPESGQTVVPDPLVARVLAEVKAAGLTPSETSKLDEYAEVLTTNAFRSIAERLRNLSRNMEAVTADIESSEDRERMYLTKIDALTDAERLTAPAPSESEQATETTS